MDRPKLDSGAMTKNVQSRRDQLRAWEASETNKVPSRMRSQQKVKFRFEVAFLAACSSSDFDEITRLLQEESVDINTSNVDGLTALHQACIDNKLELVRFLCEHGADLHARDKEGWTPLHATALGGHTEIAKYLLKRGASLTAANSDGDLPRDVAERSEMRNLLRTGLTEVEEAAARDSEAAALLADATEWQRAGCYKDIRDPVANAGPLHVAAAKGYQRALAVLLQCPGAPLEAVDNDGWTALHAAAHWGQAEACQLLVRHGANMEALTNANQTVFDLADESVKQLLHDLKSKQRELMREQVIKRPTPVISTLKVEEGRGHSMRRSSVTRLPQSERHDLTQKGAEQEKHPEKLLLGVGGPTPGKSSPPTSSTTAAAAAASAGRSPLASSESLSSDDELRQAQAAKSASQQQQQQRRPTPSPPAFVVSTTSESSSSPVPTAASTSSSALSSAKRRVEIIPAQPVTADTAYEQQQPPASRSKVRATPVQTVPEDSILTRMESLQETSSTSGVGGVGAASVSVRQNPTVSGSGRIGGIGGGGRVKSALASSSSAGTPLSASLDSPLVFPKTEAPASQSAVVGSSSASRLSQQEASLTSAERLDRLLGASKSSTSATSAAVDQNGRSSLSPQRQPAVTAANRRVSVIMEKEKTEESETERRRISRHNRATKRLTQGVTPDDVEQARKLMATKAGTLTTAASSGPTDSVDNMPAVTASASTASSTPAAAPTAAPSVTTAPVTVANATEENNVGSLSRASESNSSVPDRLFRIRPDSYHGGNSTQVPSAAAATDYRLLYDTEKIRSEQLERDNLRMKRELERLRRQLESQQQQQQQQQQRSGIDRSLAGYEAQEKIVQAEAELNKLRQENSKLKADNTSLIRVISRLSTQPAAT